MSSLPLYVFAHIRIDYLCGAAGNHSRALSLAPLSLRRSGPSTEFATMQGEFLRDVYARLWRSPEDATFLPERERQTLAHVRGLDDDALAAVTRSETGEVVMYALVGAWLRGSFGTTVFPPPERRRTPPLRDLLACLQRSTPSR